jgi:positive regulator of sigma E activity
MVIDCSQCAYGASCADCVVTVLVGKENTERVQKMDTKAVSGAEHALGARELKALNVLATAGLVPPLRYRPTPVGELSAAIVAL